MYIGIYKNYMQFKQLELAEVKGVFAVGFLPFVLFLFTVDINLVTRYSVHGVLIPVLFYPFCEMCPCYLCSRIYKKNSLNTVFFCVPAL